MLERASALFPHRPHYAVGVSLGGNALLKYLGEVGDAARKNLERAAAVCAPIDLVATAEHLQSSHFRFYNQYFLQKMKASVRHYKTCYPDLADWPRVFSAKSVYDFDEYFTAPVHGFSGAIHLWKEGSAAPLLSRINVPTLLLNSADDPIVPINSLRNVQTSPAVTRCITEQGGHVGFIDGTFPGHLRWLPNTLLDYFERNSTP